MIVKDKDSSVIENKKIDLIKFQENLNTKFQEISSQKKNEEVYLFNSSEFLGLTSKIDNINIVLSLQDLKSLSSKTIFENSIRSKSWLLGFNQEQGNIYTIFNLQKVIPLLLRGHIDYEELKLKDTLNIVYLKTVEENYGMLLESLKLINLKELKNIYDSSNLINDIINIKLLSEKIILSDNAKLIIKKIDEINFINNIFIDEENKEIFFVLDIKNCVNFLKESNPF